MTDFHAQPKTRLLEELHLHVVSFDIPYPANYGGVIDVYYRLLNLSKAGVKIHLHCFEYGREHALELNAICHSVHYYKRDVLLKNLFKKTPYIVCSRNNQDLKNTLLADDYPILIEGLHCCAILEDRRFENRNIMVRAHNIEQDYYRQLAHQEHRFWKRIYLRSEAEKLKNYEPVLAKATSIVAINRSDRDYLLRKFARVTWIPSHHKYDSVISPEGRGSYLLYHGNLSVPENSEAAAWLVEHVFSKIDFPVKIAGMNPPKFLVEKIAPCKHIALLPNPSDEEMEVLLRNAQLVLLYTMQTSGLKLKLLNTLFSARFCIVNSKMLEGTHLDALCEIADTAEEMLQKIRTLSVSDFSKAEIERRESMLSDEYSNCLNTERWLKLLKK